MFERMLANKNITIQLNTNFSKIRNNLSKSTHIVYTGPLDTYFNYEYGKLDYRTLSFEKEIIAYNDYQGTSIINYPERYYPYTRICEPKHFYKERWKTYHPEKTIIIKEFSSFDDIEEPFYPIKNKQNENIANKYREKSKSIRNMTIGGRLGDYQYYDMDSTVSEALRVSDTLLQTHK